MANDDSRLASIDTSLFFDKIEDKISEALKPDVIEVDKPLNMGSEELQTLTNRLEHFAMQGIVFTLDDLSREVSFDIPEELPTGTRVLVKQFKAKTLWMAVLRSILEEAEKNLSTQH